MSGHDLSSDAIADRVNCYELGTWIDALADNGGVVLRAPLDANGSSFPVGGLLRRSVRPAGFAADTRREGNIIQGQVDRFV